MDNISANLKFSLCQKEVVAIHRVPHAQKENYKTKNIIIKLTSRILKDNLLSKFRLVRGLNTEQLGFTGTPQLIYNMHEHLTLKKKQLFRQVRKAARQHNFKYVWVKHATILVRETDSEPAIAIRSTQDISKIKPNSRSKNL